MHWLGAVQDVETVFAAIDVLAQTSRAEAMPLVLLEAMASGVPIVALGVGGVPEVIDSGETGVLIGTSDWPGIASLYVGDWEGVACCVADLLVNPARRAALAAKAVARAASLFDLDATARQTGQLFRDLILGERSRSAALVRA